MSESIINQIRKKNVQAAVDKIVSHWSNAPMVVVFDGMNDPLVPKVTRDVKKRRDPLGASEPSAFFLGNEDGVVYINARKMRSAQDVQSALFHESLGHFGLRGTYGDALDESLTEVIRLRADDVAQKLRDYRLVDDLNGRLEAAEEVLADLAEGYPDLSFVESAVASIRGWVRKVMPGFSEMQFSKEEMIKRFILPARNFVLRGELNAERQPTAQPRYKKPDSFVKPQKPLTRKQFESQFAQHTDLLHRSDGLGLVRVAEIQKSGFHRGFNVNAIPAYRGGMPQNIVDKKYAPLKGDVIYLAPKGAWKDGTNGILINEGWRPKPEEVIQVQSDYESMFDAYQAGIARAADAAKDAIKGTYILNDKGEPLLVFHGTGVDLASLEDRATFFTSDPSVASSYAKSSLRSKGDQRPNIFPAYLKIENPLVQEGFLVPRPAGWWNRRRSALMHRGYDGVIAGNVYIPFFAEQIIPLWSKEGQAIASSEVRFRSDTDTFMGFHGTSADFKEFKPSNTGTLGAGIYFTANPEQAKAYGERVVSAQLQLKQPWRIELSHDSHQAMLEDIDSPCVEALLTLPRGREILEGIKASGSSHFGLELQNHLLALGYDGIVGTYEDGSQELVAFSLDSIEVDSDQDPLSQVKTQAFKKWFGASQVKGDDGAPLVVSRGESSGVLFNEFDRRKTNEGVGFFFAEIPEHAGFYAGRSSTPRNFYLSAQKVLDLTDPYSRENRSFIKAYSEEFDEWIDRRSGEETDVFSLLETGSIYDYEGTGSRTRWKRLFTLASSMGYDGVRALDSTDGLSNAPVWVVFEPTQIKSATDNNGNFDQFNPDIRFKQTVKIEPAVQGDFFQEDFAIETTYVSREEIVSSRGEVHKTQLGNLNSDGKTISGSVQGVENFWNWFGDSSASERGRPLVLYHSTSADVDELVPGKKTVNNYGLLGNVETSRAGIFATPNRQFSQEYLKDAGAHNVMPVYMSLQTPFDARFDLTSWATSKLVEEGVYTRFRESRSFWTLFDNEDDGSCSFADALKRLGYDGAIFFEMDESGSQQTTYMAFESSQIKSALGNRGTFDAMSPSVRFKNDPLWRSALQEALASSDIKAVPAEGWRATFTSWVTRGIVKADELEWSGVLDWLATQQGRISREDLQKFVGANSIEVTESTYSDSQADGNFTEYQTYQMDGKSSKYKEIVLTLPVANADNKALIEQKTKRIEALDEISQEFYAEGNAKQSKVFAEKADRLRKEVESLQLKLSPVSIGTYQSPHWKVPNVLVHVRMNQRKDESGEKVLFVEEIQSDWGQAGQRSGFKTDSKLYMASDMHMIEDQPFNWKLGTIDGNWSARVSKSDYEYSGLQKALADCAVVASKNAHLDRDKVPRAPFVGKTSSWVSLAVKRVIAEAVKTGCSKVAFINGDQSARRYSLDKSIATLVVERGHTDFFKINAYDHSGEMVVDGKTAYSGNLHQIVGKEMAKTIIDSEPGMKTYRGLDLKAGGHGMKAFYSEVVPNVVKDVLRKLGGSIEKVQFKKELPAGWTCKKEDGEWIVSDVDNTCQSISYSKESAIEKALSGDELKTPSSQVGFSITETMKDHARRGMPMFQWAFHGSPVANIERFSTDFIDTGEGAQAFGWGLYFAEKEDIAEHYRKSLSRMEIYLDGSLVDMMKLSGVPLEALKAVQLDGDVQGALDGLQAALDDDQLWSIADAYEDHKQSYIDAYCWLFDHADRIKVSAGRTYLVDIPEDGELLNWNAPLSEQPYLVKMAILNDREITSGLKSRMEMENTFRRAMSLKVSGIEIQTGEEVYEALMRIHGARGASERLLELGVKGIRYKDANSRTEGGPASFNYVIFDGNDVFMEHEVDLDAASLENEALKKRQSESFYV